MPIWSEAIDRSVVSVRARACEAASPLSLALDRYDAHVAVSESCEHVRLLYCGGIIRLDIVEGTVLAGTVALEPAVRLGPELDWQIEAIRRLQSMLRRGTPPPMPDSRLPRLVLALRALDGRAEGASLRELAIHLFGAPSWPGDGDCTKSRVRRLVTLAETLQRAGPRGVLGFKI